MQARSSAERALIADAAESAPATWIHRAALLGLNCTPAVHVAAIALCALAPFEDWAWRVCAVVAGTYLPPPLAARLLRWFSPVRERRIAFPSRHFLVWWALFQLQVLYCRFPALEELLRVFPGIYSMWLRLWGARIGRLTYWSPGTVVLDRPFLDVGNDVVFGAGVRISPHLLVQNQRRELTLLLGTVKVGDRALVGGFSTLAAGAEIASNEATEALSILPPFTRWASGRRMKGGSAVPGANVGVEEAHCQERMS